MKRVSLFAVLIVLFTGFDAKALEYRDVRQSAGIYVSIEGRMHSMFGDFGALPYAEGAAREVPFVLNSDVEFWVEGQHVTTGKKEWTFAVDAEGGWTLGERNPENPALRFRIPHAESTSAVPCLTADFHLDPDAKAVVLQFSYGKHAGKILLSLQRGQLQVTRSLASLDMVKGRQHLARLREIAGLLETEQAKRPAWSGILSDLGDAMVRVGDDIHLMDLTFTEGKEDICLTITGQARGGQDAADQIAAALRTGSTPRIFTDVSRPVARLATGNETWDYEICVTAPLTKWNAPAKIDELSDGRDPAAVALELLLLEIRLIEATAASPLGVSDVQPRLLAAKRAAGVMLSQFTVRSRKEEGGLVKFPVHFRVSGGGEAIITFIRSLEDCGAPLTIIPERMCAGLNSCDLELTVIFYDYVTLANREPAIHEVIAPLKLKPGFGEKVDLYLQGSGRGQKQHFLAPGWKRDPFVLSGE